MAQHKHETDSKFNLKRNHASVGIEILHPEATKKNPKLPANIALKWPNKGQTFYVSAKIALFSFSPHGAILWVVFCFLSWAIYFSVNVFLLKVESHRPPHQHGPQHKPHMAQLHLQQKE